MVRFQFKIEIELNRLFKNLLESNLILKSNQIEPNRTASVRHFCPPPNSPYTITYHSNSIPITPPSYLPPPLPLYPLFIRLTSYPSPPTTPRTIPTTTTIISISTICFSHILFTTTISIPMYSFLIPYQPRRLLLSLFSLIPYSSPPPPTTPSPSYPPLTLPLYSLFIHLISYPPLLQPYAPPPNTISIPATSVIKNLTTKRWNTPFFCDEEKMGQMDEKQINEEYKIWKKNNSISI